MFKGQFRVHGGGFLSFELPLYMWGQYVPKCVFVCVFEGKRVCVCMGGAVVGTTHPAPLPLKKAV